MNQFKLQSTRRCRVGRSGPQPQQTVNTDQRPNELWPHEYAGQDEFINILHLQLGLKTFDNSVLTVRHDTTLDLKLLYFMY